MSELKAVHAFDVYEAYTKTGDDDEAQVYLKSEADKVIAELEENHKKEVGQLLIEIKRLENLCASYRHDCDNLAIREANALKEIERDNKRLRHHKYKRCLAMAEMCNARHDEEDAKVNGHGASWEYKSKEMKYWERLNERWLKIAYQFKEGV